MGIAHPARASIRLCPISPHLPPRPAPLSDDRSRPPSLRPSLCCGPPNRIASCVPIFCSFLGFYTSSRRSCVRQADVLLVVVHKPSRLRLCCPRPPLLLLLFLSPPHLLRWLLPHRQRRLFRRRSLTLRPLSRTTSGTRPRITATPPRALRKLLHLRLVEQQPALLHGGRQLGNRFARPLCLSMF